MERDILDHGPAEGAQRICWWDVWEQDMLTRELFVQYRRVVEAERALQNRDTKTAREDVRIGANDVAATLRRLDALKVRQAIRTTASSPARTARSIGRVRAPRAGRRPHCGERHYCKVASPSVLSVRHTRAPNIERPPRRGRSEAPASQDTNTAPNTVRLLSTIGVPAKFAANAQVCMKAFPVRPSKP